MIRVDCFISHIFLPRTDSQNVLIFDIEAMNSTSNLRSPLSRLQLNCSPAVQEITQIYFQWHSAAKCADSKGPRYSLMGTKCDVIQKWTANEMCLNSINSNHPLAA